MWRRVGKCFQELWTALAVIGFVIGDMMDLYDGTWLDTYGTVISLLLLAWLACFAVGVAREEPTP